MFQVLPLVREALPGAVIVCALVLLAACAGSPLQTVPDAPDSALAHSVRAARRAVDMRTPRMQRLTAKLVMAEWGTRGLGRNKLMEGAEQAWQSIEELLTSTTCNACEERPYNRQVMAAARKYGVPASLIHAVIFKESNYKPNARSSRHALGLMQITPETGRFLGVTDRQALLDPETNIDAGTAYLKYLMSQHDSVDEVLAAYNAGSGNVRKYGGVPPFSETRRYLRDVKREMMAINMANQADGD